MKIKYLKKKSSLSNIKSDFTGLVKIRFVNSSYDTYFYKNGKLHNENGPASIEFCNLKDTISKWYLEGKEYSENEFNEKIKDMNITTFTYANLVPKDFTGVCRIESIKQKCFYKDGKLHREHGPAAEDDDGSKYWYLNGLSHREDGPAFEYSGGLKYWYKNGQYHREDGPAVEYPSGGKEWRINGKLHRVDGPAIVWSDGFKEWWIEGNKYSEKEFNKKIEFMNMKEFYLNLIPNGFTGVCKIKDMNNQIRYYKNGQIHNESGPAVLFADNTKQWLIDGVHHRLDGPAIERADGIKFWYIKGREYTKEKYDEKISIQEFKSIYDIPKDFTGIAKLKNLIIHYKAGKRHREDGPACENEYGKSWWLNGQVHRENGPAVEYADGQKKWCQNGLLHRLDGPAIESASGLKQWYIEGESYTKEEFDKKVKYMNIKEFEDYDYIPSDFTGACKLLSTKEICYYKDGKKHREDGPAIVFENSDKNWYINGLRHREDGPAVEETNGRKVWYINNINYTEEVFNKIKDMHHFKDITYVPKDFTGVSYIVEQSEIIHYKDGKIHNEKDYAVENLITGNKAWYKNGKRHRLNGPARERKNKDHEWWIEGKLFSKENFDKKIHIMNTVSYKYQYLRDVPIDFTGVCEVSFNKQIIHYKNGRIHREDGPACEATDSDFKSWNIDGKLHRLDGPAIEWANGDKEWYIEGEALSKKAFDEYIFNMNMQKFKHTNDVPKNFTGPCKITGDNEIHYYKYGKLHREDGPAIECANGSKHWCINNELHREDGPASEYYDGEKHWLLNGVHHRTDGPAIEYKDGNNHWYLHGKLHREDGPAIERPNDKAWYINGKKHREDGPAVERVDRKDWYINNLRHREDGPAIEYADGRKEWYLNGKHHRTDGPAIEEANGRKEWWLNGKLHRKDGPAVEYESGRKEWWLNNQLHRIDGPAIEHANGSKSWYVNNKYHREDGPAIEHADGDKEWYLDGEKYSEDDFNKKMFMKEFDSIQDIPEDFTGVCEIKEDKSTRYYKNGKPHRENGASVECKTFKAWHKEGELHREDGPAMEWVNGEKRWYKNGEIHRDNGPAREHPGGNKTWYKNGKRHREDGPAIEWSDGSKFWYIDDELHRLDGPAREYAEGSKEWYINGQLHRTDGPAIEKSDGEKQWYLNGKLHREDGPAIENNEYKAWVVNGKYHRLDGPAVEDDGAKYWYQNGKYHRENGPAVEYQSGYKEWYIDGTLHRTDGPAIEYADGTKAWYINGKRHRDDGPAFENTDGISTYYLNGIIVDSKDHSDIVKLGYKFQKDHYLEPKSNYTGVIISDNEDIAFYKNGGLHRENGPSIIYSSGSRMWSINDKMHRLDGPSFTSKNIDFWHKDGVLHREDGPAMIIKEINSEKYFIDGKELSLNEFQVFQNGTRERPKKIDDSWIMPDNFTGVVDHEGHLKTYKMGLLHSENDLPSYESKSKNVKNWHKNGELHRINNPAVDAGDAGDYKAWYVDGELLKSFAHGKYYDGNGLLIQPKIIKQVQKATYRVAAEKTTNIIREIITKKIADKSNYPTANFIMSSAVGKSMLQSAIGVVINQLPYDNEYMNTFSEELLISSISNIENSLIDSMFKSISFDINSSIKQIRIDQANIIHENEIEDEDIYHGINQSSFL